MSIRRCLRGLLTLLVLTCAWSAAAGPVTLNEEEKQKLDQLRAEARDLIKAQMELSWKRRTTGEKVDVAATYRDHGELFSLDSLLLTSRGIADARHPARRRALIYFRNYLYREMLNMRVAEQNDEINRRLTAARFEYRGKQYPYFEHRRLLTEEADYAARGRIAADLEPILKDVDEPLVAKQETLRRLSRELGAENYLNMAERLRGLDLPGFSQLCKQFLADTEQDYRTLLAAVSLSRLQLPVEHLRRCDFPRLFDTDEFDKYFRKDKMLTVLELFLGEMGLSLNGIQVEDSDRPQKNPRAACYAMTVPDDIRLTFRPLGGVENYLGLWHEMGHALHFANTRYSTWEFQQLGDFATVDAFSFLLDGLLENPQFVEAYLGLSDRDLKRYTALMTLRKLAMIRAQCGEFLYELELHAGVENPRERYEYWMEQAYGVELEPSDTARYLLAVEDFLAGADYLRAWMLAAMLEDQLVKRFGDRWFNSKDAGKYLLALWRTGQYYDTEGLVRAIGLRDPEASFLIERLRHQAGGE